MATEQQLLDRIAALEAQRASGTARVRYDGKEIEYRSVEDINRAIAADRVALAALAGRVQRRRIKIVAHKDL